MLLYFPNGLNTFPYARISTRIVEEGDQLNNYISEGSSPSEQGTGKLGSEPTRLVTSSWTGEIVVNQETHCGDSVLNQRCLTHRKQQRLTTDRSSRSATRSGVHIISRHTWSVTFRVHHCIFRLRVTRRDV